MPQAAARHFAARCSGAFRTFSFGVAHRLPGLTLVGTMQKIVFWVGLSAFVFFSALTAAPKIGEQAPDFTLADIDGKKHSLADYRGKFVVLEWVNHGCPFVKKHYNSGNMQALQKRFTDEGAIWLAINTSTAGQQGNMSPEEWKKVSQENKAAHSAILLDGDAKVARAYDAKVTPHMYVIDPDGKLIYNGAIDSIRSANVADVEKAENYVVTAISAAREGRQIERPVTQAYGCAIRF
jgi:peroxiredoxin